MNYDRQKAQREHIEHVRGELSADMKAPDIYRAELFRKMKNSRIGSNVSQLGDREIASDCRLSVGTVRAALAGNAVQIATLWKLSRYFGIPWALVWDVDKRFKFDIRADGTGIEFQDCNGKWQGVK